MSGRLEGRGAVVTGGGRGIGAAVARALAAEGARVVVAARTVSEVESVAREIESADGAAWPAQVDVTDAGSVDALAEAARGRLGDVEILVNSAGIAYSAPLARQTLEEWERIFAVNVTGTFLATKAFLPTMMELGRGRVINLASVAGLAGAKYIGAYAASKHAVVGFTRSVAAEAAPRGVTVNAICPGYVDTALTDESVARIVDRAGLSEAEAREAIIATSPQRRLIAPEEVARAVTWLCEDAARGVNGQTIVIDGRRAPGVTRFEIVNPKELGRPSGFSHGIVAPQGGRVLFVAGQTAPDAGDLVGQFAAALERALAVVRDAGGKPEHVARMTVYVTDMAAYRAERPRIGDAWRAAMGRHFPAMALVEVRSLVDPAAVVEIETTAVLPPAERS